MIDPMKVGQSNPNGFALEFIRSPKPRWIWMVWEAVTPSVTQACVSSYKDGGAEETTVEDFSNWLMPRGD